MPSRIKLGRYACIYADPPWHFRVWNETNNAKSASRHYDLMTMEELMRLPVGALAAPDCALFMWVIDAMIPEALALGKQWGFKYKTVAFYWAKTSKNDPAKFPIGTGYWTRANPEACFLFTKGNPKRISKAVPKLIVSPRREHSRKPDEAVAGIEALCAGPRLELFAREKRRGWGSWGNQTTKFN